MKHQATLKPRRIQTQTDQQDGACRLSGWFDGKRSYLRIADRDDTQLGTISDGRLYRLAKTIVKYYEADTGESK
jgi:hypothetical protein